MEHILKTQDEQWVNIRFHSLSFRDSKTAYPTLYSLMPVSLLLRRVRQLLSILLISWPLASMAQALPEPIKFGQVDSKDLTAAPFVADSASAAVVLCDFGRSRIDGHGDKLQVVFERVRRIKILKKSGYDEATVEIPLYHREGNQEKVTNLRGYTYNLINGTVETTRLEPGGAFLEKRTTTVNVQKFTLPNVREGCVIEYAYTLSSDFLFNFQDWEFQHEIPVRWSEYRVSIPVFYKYKIIYQGTQPLTVDKASIGKTSMRIDGSGGIGGNGIYINSPTEEHQWVLQNVPAFRNEPYMTTPDDYLDRMDFQLLGTQWPDEPYHDLSDSWPKINARLLNDAAFGLQLDRGNFLKDQMQALAVKYPIIEDRAAAVREVVMAGVRYDGHNRYSSENSLRKAYDAHHGTSAEVNLLLIAALRDAGIPAEPVLLSTRDHGRINKEYPLLDKFNYVVALVELPNGQDLLVDATEPLLPCGVLPRRCLNQTGRLIPARKKDEGRWVSLEPAQHEGHFQQATLVLDATGGLSGQVREEFTGYASLPVRQDLAELGGKKFLARLVQQHDGWIVPDLTVADFDSVSKPVGLRYTFSRGGSEAAPTSTLYLSPLRELSDGRNPFRHDSRRFPVDLGVPQDETAMVTLTLPPGYELAEKPKNMVLELAGGSARFVYNVTATGQTVQLLTRLSLRSTIYPAGQYADLRELFRQVLARQSEKLIIQKKSGG
jgi:transglutaminase-like putative cysteine protease